MSKSHHIYLESVWGTRSLCGMPLRRALKLEVLGRKTPSCPDGGGWMLLNEKLRQFFHIFSPSMNKFFLSWILFTSRRLTKPSSRWKVMQSRSKCKHWGVPGIYSDLWPVLRSSNDSIEFDMMLLSPSPTLDKSRSRYPTGSFLVNWHLKRTIDSKAKPDTFFWSFPNNSSQRLYHKIVFQSIIKI